MEWMNQISGLLQQYQNAQPQQAPATVDNDFDQFTQAAPQSALADGLAAAFRSDQTPPFGQMTSQLFGQSNGQQRASILNTLLSTLGPTILSQILNRSGGSGLAGLLGGGQQQQVTPEQAEQISPEAVQGIAEEAAKRDPSIIDSISNVYAEHPTLIKTLGGAALTIALAKIAQRQYGG
ncbi:MAG TPA: hypothetical protein VNA19_08750 [Pyrinomonadaceae bacterium]|jgi:hypothetical protein|nr:hypothetical protein [Pyrinomonadaceae bacterium]